MLTVTCTRDVNVAHPACSRDAVSPLLSATARFQSSGWFVVRTVADNPKTLRIASTAPFYVEIGETKRRISKTAAQFFIDWTEERAGRVKLEDSDQRREVLEYYIAAKKFLQDVRSKSNTD